MTIRRHSFLAATSYFFGSLEETLGRFHIEMLGKHGVDEITVAVYGSVKIAPFPAD